MKSLKLLFGFFALSLAPHQTLDVNAACSSDTVQTTSFKTHHMPHDSSLPGLNEEERLILRSFRLELKLGDTGPIPKIIPLKEVLGLIELGNCSLFIDLKPITAQMREFKPNTNCDLEKLFCQLHKFTLQMSEVLKDIESVEIYSDLKEKFLESKRAELLECFRQIVTEAVCESMELS